MTKVSKGYNDQLADLGCDIDIDFWRQPEGVAIPDDELNFLLIPDAVEALAAFELAKQVHAYQADRLGTKEQITRALMVTMGGLLPSVLLYDHIVEGRQAEVPEIKFGTIGVSLYKGPGDRYENPLIQHGISIPVNNRTVLIMDDLGDFGETLKFLTRYVLDSGARKALSLVMYMKPAAKKSCSVDFCFGEIPQDTWIITPREMIETLIKRVPVWKQRGASYAECRRRLIDLIGYRPDITDYYLPLAYD